MPDHDGPWSSPPKPATQSPSNAGPRRWLIWLGLMATAIGVFSVVWWLFPRQASGADKTDIAYTFGLLILVSSSLIFSRQLKLRDVAVYAIGWAGIVGVLILGYTYRAEATELFFKVRSELIPAYAVNTKPHTLTVQKEEDGAFYILGKVNGAPVRFLLDTGASDIVLSPGDAKRLGLGPEAMNFNRSIETANGVGKSASTTIDRLEVGPIQLDHPVVSVNQAPMASSILGMAFFKTLDTFDVKGSTMTLKYKG